MSAPLPEQRPATTGQPPAQWWKRLAALVVDTLVLLVPTGVLLAIWSVVAREGEGTGPGGGEILSGREGLPSSLRAAIAVAWVLNFLYYWLLNSGPRGQTVGKRALGIQVRHAGTGGPLGFGRGALRQLVFLLFARVPFFLGVLADNLWPLWDRRGQALHDKLAGSIVVDLVDVADPADAA